jgi:hypothetical protein
MRSDGRNREDVKRRSAGAPKQGSREAAEAAEVCYRRGARSAWIIAATGLYSAIRPLAGPAASTSRKFASK